MFDVLTINIAFELFGLFFCLVCVSISVLSQDGTGHAAQSAADIRNLFICDAFIMFSDAMAGIFRGKEGELASAIVHIGNFFQFACNYMLFGLMVNLLTHMVPSEYDRRFRRIAWGFVIADTIILIWNLFSGKIYYITDLNIYVRAEWFPLSQIAGLACVAVGASYLIQYRKNAKRRVILLFTVFAALCVTALFVQMFTYGIAWLNISMLGGLVIVFVYNQMYVAESLAEKRKIIAEQTLQLEQSRIQLMMSQIKPHFLFNTLTSIAQLCDESPQDAKAMTLAFSKYLRGNMHSLEEPKPIPFTDELTHIKCYLKIEQVRFSDYLNVEYDLGVTDFSIPCLTVQPLIENAVKHGVGQKDVGGTVTLRTEETDNAYIVTVLDDGVGFDTDAPRRERSLGIRNIEARLKMLCDAKLTIESKVGAGTTAQIIIPKKRTQTEQEERRCP